MQFGMMMCFGMVTVMTCYNLWINGLFGKISVQMFLGEFIIGLLVAFVMDMFVVGPVAKKLALSLPYDKSKKKYMILSISLFMIIGMVLTMSLYGLGTAYIANGLLGESLLTSYFKIAGKNFIMALPLQLVVMGPIVRFLFMKFVKAKPQVAQVSA